MTDISLAAASKLVDAALEHARGAGLAPLAVVVLDAGAVQKLSLEGKSLLPIGVVEVSGEFGRGDVITCVDENGRAIARGMSNYNSSDARLAVQRNEAQYHDETLPSYRSQVEPQMVKTGAVVIDVGINRLPDGRITGDVDFEGVAQKASFITPVPGGVGPMTVTMLLENTVAAAERAAEVRA